MKSVFRTKLDAFRTIWPRPLFPSLYRCLHHLRNGSAVQWLETAYCKRTDSAQRRSSSLPPFLRRLSTRDRRFESTGEDHMSHYFTRCRTTEIRAFEARCRGGMSRHPREWAGCSPVSRPFRACPPSTPDIHQTSLGRPARQAAIMALTPIKEFAS